MIIDLSSNNNHPIDYAAASNVVDAVIIKATEGTGYTNPFYVEDVAGFLAHGKPVVAYHFASFGDAGAEAAHFKDVAGSRARWLDAETDTNYPWMVAFLNALGLPVDEEGIYGAGWSIPQGVRYPLWIAAYGTDPNRQGEEMWQYTGSGSVPGIQGAVDLSVWKGTPEQFAVLFGETPPPSPTPDPQPPEEEDMTTDSDFVTTQDGVGHQVTEVMGGLVHAWQDQHGKWSHEIIQKVAGGPVANVVFDHPQEPHLFERGRDLICTATAGGHTYYFSQALGTNGWGVNAED